MSIPGFAAEASLYRSGKQHRGATARSRGGAVVTQTVLSVFHSCGPCKDGLQRCVNYTLSPGGGIHVGTPFFLRCTSSHHA